MNQQKDIKTNLNEAYKMWKIVISVFSESQLLVELSKYFEDNE